MKTDVQLWAQGTPTGKLPCKETLNHAALISLVSGLDVCEHTPEAFRRAYAALGIDLVNRVPLDNAQIHFANPATPLEAVEEQFGQTGRAFIGGAETGLLTRGTPDEIRSMVQRLERCTRYPGFVICSPGGLHDNIPMDNLEAYFDARVDLVATPENWRTAMKAGGDEGSQRQRVPRGVPRAW